MLPYRRFLVALMALPLSVEQRMKILGHHHCYGIDIVDFQSLAGRMATYREAPQWGEAMLSHLQKTSQGVLDEDYTLQDALPFLLQQGVEPAFRALSDTAVTPFKRAAQLMARKIQYRFIGALFIANQSPTKIAASFSKRFSMEVDEATIMAAHWMFFRLEDLTEQELANWVGVHEPMIRQVFRMAMYSPEHELYDTLGVPSPDLDLRHVAARVMARSLSKFERLSQVQHYRASSEARQWGSLAIQAAEKYEKVKGGEYVDFLAKFQIALMEADPNIVEAHVDTSTE